MAAGDRTDSIVSQAQFHLGTADQGKLAPLLKALPNSFYFDKLQRAQTKVAAELLCIEKTNAALTVTAGVAVEPTGFYRMKLMEAPSGQWLQLEEVGIAQYDLLTRNVIGTAEQTPLYFKRWAGSWTFWPTPGTGTYTVHYYGIPTTTVTTAIDPETPAYLDECLLWYLLKEAADVVVRPDLAAKYEAKYAQTKNETMSMWRRTKTSLITIANDVYA